jgi:hypothetical protein
MTTKKKKKSKSERRHLKKKKKKNTGSEAVQPRLQYFISDPRQVI